MNPSPEVLRQASPDDVPRLVELMAEFYAEGGFPLNRPHAGQAFAALLTDGRLGHVWFIQSGLKEVGHLVVTFCFSMEYGGLIAFVDDLFVQKAFRCAGLATAALAEATVWCASRGVRAIQVETGHDNIAAVAVYRRAGFVNTERLLLALPFANPTHVS